MKAAWRIGISLAFFVASTAIAYQNEPDGFRGIKWGTPLTELEGFSETSTGNTGLAMFVRANERLQIGEAELSGLRYVFYKGRLAGAMMTTSGTANKSALIQAFQTQFGRGDKPNRYLDRHIWRGGITTMMVDCPRTDCTALINSSALQAEQQADRKAGAERAKGDF